MKKVIITQLTGGLGNQLFQYAVAKTIAIKNGIPMKMDLSFFKDYKWHVYSLAPFNIDENFASAEECKQLLEPSLSLFTRVVNKLSKKHTSISYKLEEKGFAFDTMVLEEKPPKYMIGYWQSEKFFEPIKEIIRKDFEVKIPPSLENKAILDTILASNSVSIHIRRGNYVSDEVINTFHGTCSLEYYDKAISYFKEKLDNPTFYIFSNDIPWSREHLNFEGTKVFVDLNDDTTDYEDLRLMQNCKHQIIANSTFSWWAAWLNTNPSKTIIAPKQWFANEEMQAQTDDLIPENWIRL